MGPKGAGVIYEKAFFDLQLQFADAVSVLSGRPRARVLLEYTNLYVRFGLGRAFDPAHSMWQQYTAGLRETDDVRNWTYGFYLTRAGAATIPGVVTTFGCFSYARLSGERIRLHFQNVETSEDSPLAVERTGQRMTELAALFQHVSRRPNEPRHVVGASWLYNLDAYRRLFPPSYLASAHAVPRRFQHMPLWGQFLDRHGAIRGSTARQFLERLERQSSLDGLDDCFPLQVLAVEAPVQDFYDFYGTGHTRRPAEAGGRAFSGDVALLGE